MKLFDEYNLKARLIPACICIVPVLIFYYFFLGGKIAGFVNFANNYFELVGHLTAPLLSVFLLAQFSRSISKFIYEKKYFKNQTQMPTTKLLLHSDKKYSDYYKNLIRQKIFNDFNIKLATINEEKKNQDIAYKRIIEAVGLIRDKVKKSRLLLQHNIEYGFYRNLIGGSTIAFILSTFNWCFFSYIYYNKSASIISLVLIFVYVLPIIFSKTIIKNHGNLYADILFKEYLSIKN